MSAKRTKKNLINENSPLADVNYAEATKTFARSEDEGKPAATSPPQIPDGTAAEEGRPKRSFTVLLPVDQLEWIDQKHTQARASTADQKGKPFRKTAVLRALLDVAMMAEVNLAGCRDEEDIRQRLLQAIKEV